MIVYGDAHFRSAAVTLHRRLAARITQTEPDSMDQLRTLLIQAGQFEQAFTDYLSAVGSAVSDELTSSIQRITDLAADAFYSRLVKRETADRRALLVAMQAALARLTVFQDVCLVIKVPEGLQSYALYPEAYVASARRWAGKHRATDSNQATVIGIRSIGTTLSAAITATLRSMDWQIARFTVRPMGHPFRRRTSLEGHRFNRRSLVIIADEGPGLSGSSMASAAAAVVEAGADPQKLSFFPGHAGEPGAQATSEVRRWWEVISRFVTSQSSLRWDGNSLHQCLALKWTNDAVQFEDLSAGAWRAKAYPDESCWPPLARPFASIKLRSSDPGGKCVSWKFVGLGPWIDDQTDSLHQAWKQSLDRADQGWSPPPLATSHGYLAVAWMRGTPLRPLDAKDPRIIEHIGRYIAQVAGPRLPSVEQSAAIERLAQMLYSNTKEALGETLADRTRLFFAHAQNGQHSPSYGDGRMAPHKWLRTGDGRIWKTDGLAHQADHTVVGRQSVLWDVAATLIEWKLDARAAARLLGTIERSGIVIERDALKFHCLCYAGFKLGQMAFCEQVEAEPGEKARLSKARCEYQEALRSLLGEPPLVAG
jgi:hypothetical protein